MLCKHVLLFLHLTRDPLDFVHHTQQIPAPEFFNLLFCVAAADEFQRDVKCLAGVVPADDATAAVEVRRDPDVVDAEELHRVVDVVDKVFEIGRRIARMLFIDVGKLFFVFRSLFR